MLKKSLFNPLILTGAALFGLYGCQETNQSFNSETSARAPAVNDARINETLTREAVLAHSVKKGDTFSKIAKHYNISLTALRAANTGASENSLSVGQEITVPLIHNKYTVQRGDTLSAIVHSNLNEFLSVNEIMRANKSLKSTRDLHAGDILILPTGYMAHEIRKGQTLTSVAFDYNLSLSEIVQFNPTLNPDVIRIGQILDIPTPRLIQKRLREKHKENKPRESKPRENKPPTVSSYDYPDAYGIPKSDVKIAWQTAASGDILPPVRSVGDMPLVVIDPGHGAKNRRNWYDRGNQTKDERIREVDLIDPMARSLYEQLTQLGYPVAFTRNPGTPLQYQWTRKNSGGKFGTVAFRAAYATNLERQIKAPYTIFVSIHANSAENSNARGYEILLPRRTYDAKLQSNSLELGEETQRWMQELHPSKARKVTDDIGLGMFYEFANHAYGRDAAVLFELGFVTNKTDLRFLEDMRDRPYKVAAALRRGIHNYAQNPS